VRALPELDSTTFDYECRRSEETLEEIIFQVEELRPRGEVETLERELDEAVAAEAFERAADIRDRLRHLRPESHAS
jgi:excinuclease UvrABC nuclease subunit